MFEVQIVNIGTTNLMQRNWPESVPWTEKNWSWVVWFGSSNIWVSPQPVLVHITCFWGKKPDKTRPVNTSLEGLSQDALEVS